ncbi:hypothetical protein OPV22_005212 [Ensete ventricosum]|uniref:Uncharacterized protein n=1 Tax=Ensete ventricosum TaxID=4639 RepID=A0AAV8Q265_ENSVE|nr:hypothetical protein OPV22_005212 [Ensete ventricosum]
MEAARLHREARDWELEIAACQSRAAEVREELQVEVDELPATGHKEGRVQLAGGADHHPTPCPPRKQMVCDCHPPAQENR